MEAREKKLIARLYGMDLEDVMLAVRELAEGIARSLAPDRIAVASAGFAREVDGPDEARKGAREQLKAGADVVKLMATGGVLTQGVEPGATQHLHLGAKAQQVVGFEAFHTPEIHRVPDV